MVPYIGHLKRGIFFHVVIRLFDFRTNLRILYASLDIYAWRHIILTQNEAMGASPHRLVLD